MTEAEALDRQLQERHSCRAFLADSLALALTSCILAMAQRSACWCNAQRWQVVQRRGYA